MDGMKNQLPGLGTNEVEGKALPSPKMSYTCKIYKIQKKKKKKKELINDKKYNLYHGQAKGEINVKKQQHSSTQ